MIIRQDFSAAEELPPKPFLEQVMCPVAQLYCYLWEKKDGANQVSLSWNDIKKIFSKNAFRTNLRKLNNKHLLDYHETPDGIHMELVGWEEL